MTSRDTQQEVVGELTELQQQLIQVQLAAEETRIKSERLTVENHRLSDELRLSRGQVELLVAEKDRIVERCKLTLEQARRDLAVKHAECHELRAKLPSDAQLERVRMQIREEMERPITETFDALNCEVERYRHEFNRVSQQLAVAQAELERSDVEHNRMCEDLKLQHQSEMEKLRKEMEVAACRQASAEDTAGDLARRRALMRDNAELRVKLADLLHELEDVRCERHEMGLPPDAVTRLQTRQIAHRTEQCKTLQQENEALTQQCGDLQAEISKSRGCSERLSARICELERQNVELSAKLEEAEVHGHVAETDSCLKLMKEKTDKELNCRRLQATLSETSGELEAVKLCLEHQKKALVDKEKECCQRIQEAQQENRSKIHELHSQIIALETKIESLQSQGAAAAAATAAAAAAAAVATSSSNRSLHQPLHSTMIDVSGRDDEWENLCHKATCREKPGPEKPPSFDADARVSSSQHRQYLEEQLQCERGMNQDLRCRLDELQSKVDQQTTAFANSDNRLKENAQQLEAKLAATSSEKSALQREVDALKDRLHKTSLKLTDALAIYREKKRVWSDNEGQLKDKLLLLAAELERVQLERDINTACSSSSVLLDDARQRLCDLLQRHRKFSALLRSVDIRQINIGGLAFGAVARHDVGRAPSLPRNGATPRSVPTRTCYQGGYGQQPTGVANQPSQDTCCDPAITNVKQRINELDVRQQRQLTDLCRNPLMQNCTGRHSNADYGKSPRNDDGGILTAGAVPDTTSGIIVGQLEDSEIPNLKFGSPGGYRVASPEHRISPNHRAVSPEHRVSPKRCPSPAMWNDSFPERDSARNDEAFSPLCVNDLVTDGPKLP